jgi:hypothetical protein
MKIVPCQILVPIILAAIMFPPLEFFLFLGMYCIMPGFPFVCCHLEGFKEMFETKYRIVHSPAFQNKTEVFKVQGKYFFWWFHLWSYCTLEEAKRCIKSEIEGKNRPKDTVIEVDVKFTADVTEIL